MIFMAFPEILSLSWALVLLVILLALAVFAYLYIAPSFSLGGYGELIAKAAEIFYQLFFRPLV